jgi:pyruvate kinase
VAILMDLPGPKYRTGRLKDGHAILKNGAVLTLTTEDVDGDATLVLVYYLLFFVRTHPVPPWFVATILHWILY